MSPVKVFILSYFSMGFIWVIWDFRKVLRYALFVLRDSLALLRKGGIELLNPKRVQTMNYGYEASLKSPIYAGRRDFKTAFVKILFWPIFFISLSYSYYKHRIVVKRYPKDMTLLNHMKQFIIWILQMPPKK